MSPKMQKAFDSLRNHAKGEQQIAQVNKIVDLIEPFKSKAATMGGLINALKVSGTTGPTSIEIYGDETGADAMQAMVGAKFPGVEAKTWKEINRPLFLALRLEKVVMFVTISLIIFVAALNLISSLSMLIMEKRPAVGVLRTLGATDRSILSIFLQVGFSSPSNMTTLSPGLMPACSAAPPGAT